LLRVRPTTAESSVMKRVRRRMVIGWSRGVTVG
jgi:hypothetical protein